MSQPAGDKPSLKGWWSGSRGQLLTFYTQLNIPGMAEARVIKFRAVVGYIKR